MKKVEKPKQSAKPAADSKKTKVEGYPKYPAGEDIYRKAKEVKDIDPEDSPKTKSSIPKDHGGHHDNDFDDDLYDGDLDVPGSELDDDLENIGSEDEENNYYSIGGDNHNDLEEDNEEE